MATFRFKGDYGGSMFVTDRPRFFKIILDNTIKDGKLGIPRKFARKYGNDLSNPVIFQVPSGAVWEVELVKSDDGMWFQKGWEEFAKFYSIADAHFLVFEYKKSCHFHVLIFDRSACEVDYPLANGDKEPNVKSKHSRNEKAESDDSVELLEHMYPSHKSKCPPQYPEPRKNMDNNSTSTFAVSSKSKVLLPPIGDRFCDPKLQVKENVGWMRLPGQNGSLNRMVRRTKRLTNHEKVNALSRATTAFMSNNPFFLIAMQPTYVYSTRKVGIPSSFARKHLKESGNTLLCGLDGKTWPVLYRFNAKHTSGYFLHGWRNFVEANQLEVGDICAFELFDTTKMSFRVTIFRAFEMLS
ncbi:hypothetical protein K2173_005971 [Erythroxylum novogranatense]|uniref:TF-B3 domain-containing protein n=1 Tax=Erythroxylum novogranatense TaxID=1862640 RepID=A0AAV8TBL0_9ROSI|nr:hypothetical protein K2173_005971 [Erythroxylum novogranatense]